VIARARIGDLRALVIANISRTEQPTTLSKEPGTGFRPATLASPRDLSKSADVWGAK
jgi:hypothetical protein